MRPTTETEQFFQINASIDPSRTLRLILRKNRHLIGSSNYCDFVLDKKGIDDIHAVVERVGTKFRIYDMDSTSGVFVNGQKIVVQEISTQDEIQVGPVKLSFGPVLEDSIPLDILDPVVNQDKNDVIYPLSKDPKAEFSGYIFEDYDKLYPIFHYPQSGFALEVITAYKKRILDVYFLPQKKNKYFLTGQSDNRTQLAFSYFDKKEKILFAEINDFAPLIYPLQGFNSLVFTDEGVKKNESFNSLTLKKDEIIRFHKDNVEIFLRTTDLPPRVKRAPLLQTDSAFGGILFVLLLLISVFLGTIHRLEVDEELEKRKAPKRLARIIQKRRPLKIAPKKAIQKTENKPKEIIQKSPEKIPVPKKETKPLPKEKPAPAPKPTPKPKTIPKAAKKAPQKTLKKAAAPKKRTPPPKAQRSSRKRGSGRKSKLARNQKGRVDSYKSFNFAPTLNNLLSKGGSRSSGAAGGKGVLGAVDIQGSGLETGKAGAIKKANVTEETSNLSSLTRGRLDNRKGISDIVGKKSIHTAGLPFTRVVLGGMNPDDIRSLLIENLPRFRYCYQKELDSAGSRLDGRVHLGFSIGSTGDVFRAEVLSSAKAIAPRVSKCVISVIKGIKFPRPPGGGEVEVTQWFNFFPRG